MLFCGALARPLFFWLGKFNHFLAVLRGALRISLKGDFFMPFFKIFVEKLFRSPLLDGQTRNRKIAYLGVTTAFAVIVNTLFEFKFLDTQYSLTIAVSSLLGVLLGGGYGFVVCFLGDLVGFLINSSGYAYMPWIGISMGLVAMLSGLIVGGIPQKKSWFVYIKLLLVCIVTFLLCTVAINTTAFWILYSKAGYFEYLFTRLFVQGQIWNSLVNYGLLFGIVPALNHIKPLKIYIK